MTQLGESYELSIWEDIIQPKFNNQDEYFDEQKLAVISSADLNFSGRAFDVKIKTSINGEKTLTFNLLRQYQEEGELIFNPFLNLLVNERKVKLRLGLEYEWEEPIDLEEEDNEERWMSFVIKDIDEDKNSYINTYTAKEIYVNELGKNGWSVILDTELENNYGTLTELATKVLDGSDWEVGPSYEPVEAIVEPLVEGTVSIPFLAYSARTGAPKTIIAGEKIYFGYSFVQPGSSTNWKLKEGVKQFLWRDTPFTSADYNEDYLITDDDLNYNYESTNISVTNLRLMGLEVGEPPLQGQILYKVIETVFDAKLGKYINKYKVTNSAAGLPVNTLVNGYDETEYIVTGAIPNLLTNSVNFVDTIGWLNKYDVGVRVLPEASGDPISANDWSEDDVQTNYLAIPLGLSGIKNYYNEGPKNLGLKLVKEDKFLVRMKARLITKDTKDYGFLNTNIIATPSSNLSIVADIVEYDNVSVHPQAYSKSTLGNLYSSSILLDQTVNPKDRGYPVKFSGERLPYSPTGAPYFAASDEEGYFYTYLEATETTTKDQKLMLRLMVSGGSANTDLCIEDIQFFNYVKKPNGLPIFPGEVPEASIETRTRYYYYSNDELKYLPSNETYYSPKYRDGYLAVRHIDVKESNYFNNLTSLAELFEVWIKFHIKHQKNGKILLNNKNKPCKQVIFSRYTPYGQEYNSAGFKYGVNLKNVKRRVASDAIATKVIVKNNNQRYAKDGTCSIMRAYGNPSGENTIFNFDYYVKQDLLKQNQVLKDLYGLSLEDLSYLPELKVLNNEYTETAELMLEYAREITEAEKFIEYYEEGIGAAKDAYEDEHYIYNNTSPGDTKVRDRTKTVMTQLHAQANSFRELRVEAIARKAEYQIKLDNSKQIVDNILEQKKNLHNQFYEKYSRYIQEGIWTDANYVDDDLYFLDALKISEVSAFPKVSYDMEVADVHALPGFENYEFKVGQRTYIEDTEFFGWVYKSHDGLSQIKTPYQMEVIISEYIHNLDNPEKSNITIQNYKNQYEDLFQKIVATTNQLQYQSGQFASIADQFDNGILKRDTLEEAFSKNAFILANSTNQNVTWDSRRGIEVTDMMNTNLILRIVSRGLFLTSDGGNTWDAAITGRGINTRYLRAGEIDADRINIITRGLPIFRWDGEGITAFVEDDFTSYDADRFVRFNQYGLYGTTKGNTLQEAVDNGLDFFEKQEAVKEYSNFSLTWDGLFFHTPSGGSAIFGRYGGGDDDYGLLIKNAEGDEALKADSDGNLVIMGTLSSSNYISGLSGWKIDRLGTAEFENAIVRGMLKSTVFVYDEINAQGGSLIIARSGILKDDLELPNGVSTVSFEIKDYKPGIFNVGETLKVETHLTPEQKIIVWLKVTNIVDNTVTAQVLLRNPNESFTIPAGVPLINYGVKDTGYILLKADELNTGPYIDVITNTSTNVHSGGQELNLRLGDLQGITNPLFGGQLSGYGLYADNVYLKGSIILPDAGITDYTNSSVTKNIRIWAGSTYSTATATNSTTPFRVYDDGSMIANQGEIAKWLIDSNKISSQTTTGGSFVLSSAKDTGNLNWLTAKNNDNETTFYVTKTGKLFANDADIKGTIWVGDKTLAGVLGGIEEDLEDGLTVFGQGFAAFVNRATGSNPPENNDYSTTTILGGVIKTETITADQIASNAITAGKIKAEAVTAGKIAANAVTTGNIVAGAITTTELAGGAVTAEKIFGKTIVSDNIAGDAITAEKIKAGAVTAGKINVSTLSAISANLGSITAGSISGVSLNIGNGFAVTTAGTITSTSGTIGGFTITSNSLYGGSGNSYVKLSTDMSDVAIRIGNESSSTKAPFRVNHQGKMVATDAHIEGGTLTVGSYFSVSSTGEVKATSISDAYGKIRSNSSSTLLGSHTGLVYASTNSTLAGITISARTGGVKIAGSLEVTGTFYSFSKGLIVGAQGAPATKTLHYGDFQIYGKFTDSSDIYYKQNIKNLDTIKIVKEIYNIEIIEYEKKDSPGIKRIGIIANEMVKQQPVLSSYIISPDEEGYLSVNYLDIHNASILAIQDLNNRLIKLEEKLK